MKNGAMECLFLQTFEVVFVREPSLLPVFGKLGIKTPVVVAAAPTMSKSIKNIVSLSVFIRRPSLEAPGLGWHEHARCRRDGRIG
ncbi:MAG: hypothetical protein EOS14_01225 [Mesorhizobium sp.]|nr:MAG: hypothetical protein EOS14_01225 [Mesorhizobium sp.]